MRSLSLLPACQMNTAMLFKSPGYPQSANPLRSAIVAFWWEDVGPPTCRIPARSTDLRLTAFPIDGYGVVVQLGKRTDI